MNLRLADCTENFWSFVLSLRNKVRDSFLSTDLISEVDHVNFMTKYSSTYRICIDNDIPIGFIGAVNGDIRLAVEPSYQGRQVASFMLKEFASLVPHTKEVKVRLDNLPSQRFFERNGYKAKCIVLEKE